MAYHRRSYVPPPSRDAYLDSHHNFNYIRFYPRECGICLEDLHDSTRLEDMPIQIRPCDHIFCKACIEQWLEEANTCPHCRQILFEDAEKDEPRDNNESKNEGNSSSRHADGTGRRSSGNRRNNGSAIPPPPRTHNPTTRSRTTTRETRTGRHSSTNTVPVTPPAPSRNMPNNNQPRDLSHLASYSPSRNITSQRPSDSDTSPDLSTYPYGIPPPPGFPRIWHPDLPLPFGPPSVPFRGAPTARWGETSGRQENAEVGREEDAGARSWRTRTERVERSDRDVSPQNYGAWRYGRDPRRV
ncbi:hypothetical protein P280DRAFT_510220 [Massarina eburnea CBS 473.64]|uniref:RING-type domain-containing protein n=1 Tax=Massarina eburnea CBS 473.64 TaxID=1395130 RepID=A0A6A6RSD2_9PLEO|nr:hypothetical protein P280DRAFT_510220 [Massarina eburnea CBS 473.64]